MNRLIAFMALATSVATAAAQDTPPPIETVQVVPGVHVLYGQGGNIGVSTGSDGMFLIDDQYANLTDKVWTIEIIKPLAERTRAIYDKLIARGYTEFRAVSSKNADGYYGWEEHAPFDKIIVTCGIDHIPPPLLQQLKVGGDVALVAQHREGAAGVAYDPDAGVLKQGQYFRHGALRLQSAQ